MENIGYFLIAIVAFIWVVAMIGGMIVAYPAGIIGLILILGLGFLFARVIKDRLSNKEDDYYSENVDK